MTCTIIVKRSSGYWHVRFGRRLYVQWPDGLLPSIHSVFGARDDQDRDKYMKLAMEAVDAHRENDAARETK